MRMSTFYLDVGERKLNSSSGVQPASAGETHCWEKFWRNPKKKFIVPYFTGYANHSNMHGTMYMELMVLTAAIRLSIIHFKV